MSRRGSGVGSDTDAELTAYFNGGYAAELGLRSSTGAQLDRLSFKLGASSVRTPDGFNDRVKIGVVGPAGLLEVGKVELALRRIASAPGGAVTFAVLRGYYTRRPIGAYEGLREFKELVGVTPCCPRAIALVEEWMRRRLDEELVANEAAIAASRVGHEEALGVLRGQLRVELGQKAKGWKRRAAAVQKRLDAADGAGAPPKQDTAEAISQKWAARTEDRVYAVLRGIDRASRGVKDAPERQEARKAIDAVLDEARALHRAARTAYAAERKLVERDLREAMERARKAPDEAFLAGLQWVPGDVD